MERLDRKRPNQGSSPETVRGPAKARGEVEAERRLTRVAPADRIRLAKTPPSNPPYRPPAGAGSAAAPSLSPLGTS